MIDEVINEVNVNSHVSQWLKSNQSFEVTEDLANDVDAVNRSNKRDWNQEIYNFASTLGIQVQERHDKKEAWEEKEELGVFLFRQSQSESLGSSGVKQLTSDKQGFADNEQSVTRALNSDKTGSGTDTANYINRNTAKPSTLTDEKIGLAMQGLQFHLDKTLNDPERVWTMSNGDKFNINNWSPEEAAWAREQEQLYHYKNNGIIDLTKINLAYLTPYLRNIQKSNQTWADKQRKIIGGRDGAVLRSSEFTKTIKSNGSAGDMGQLLETYRLTEDGKGNRLGRVGAMEQLKVDLTRAVSAGTISADAAFESIYKVALGHRWKGSGKTLAEEYPRFSVDSIEGQAFHNELKKAYNTMDTIEDKFRKKKMDDQVQGFYDSECGKNVTNPVCIEKAKKLQAEAQNIVGYATTSIDKWITRSETIPSPPQIESIKSALDAAIQGDFLFPNTRIGNQRVEDMINSLPEKDQKSYREALKKVEIFDNESFKDGIKIADSLVKTATGIVDKNATDVGNTNQVRSELEMHYRSIYRGLKYKKVNPNTDQPYTDREAASEAESRLIKYFNDNGGDRKNENGRYYVGVKGSDYGNFPNFKGKADTAIINPMKTIGNDTNEAVANLISSGLHTKDSILDNNQDIIYNEKLLKEFKHNFENKPGYLIPPKVRGLALQLGVNPIHLMNRQLKAYGIPLLESPLTPFFENSETSKLEALTKHPTNNNSIKFIHQFNQKSLDMNTVPYSRYFNERLPDDQKPFVGALVDIMNKGNGTNIQDVRDTEEIVNQFIGEDGTLDVPTYMGALESLGVDVEEYRRELYKYLNKSSLNRYTMPVTPIVRKLLNEQIQPVGTP